MYWKLLDVPDTDRSHYELKGDYNSDKAVRVSKGVFRDYLPNGDYALRNEVILPMAVDATPEASLPLPANEAPSQPSGPTAVLMDEHTTDTGADYTSTDPDGTTPSFSLGGADAESLSISAQGRLTFRSPPDYEAPGDQDEDRVYQVNVVASDGALSSLPLPVAVTVDNGPDPGVVTFSPDPPSVGQPVTASVADPDGGVTRHRNWNWSRVDAPPMSLSIRPFAALASIGMASPGKARDPSHLCGCAVCGGRTSSYGQNGPSWQEPRPGFAREADSGSSPSMSS